MVLVLLGLCLHTSSLPIRGGSTLGPGALAPLPQTHLLSPQIQKLADRFDVISGVPKCSKIQIFRGSIPPDPGPPGKAYSAPSDP